ncbi:DUF975 family protein [Clostridium perfringens]|nr:DUF975 family protein [Clostridium perfringens]MDH5095778.1 hypothetical protein [Clostridium perfringens]MDK0841091.1 DUF975 family protein [Clostridium perfringens]WDT39666.1 DUF975 family protein [Clostridium perfringens]
MTRKEIKSLSQDKLRGRWTNFLLLVLIVLGVQGLVTYFISNVESIGLSSILNLGNSFLLGPFLESLLVVFVIKLVDRDDKVGLKESIPSCKVWRNFIKKFLALILFELPISLIASIIAVVSFISIISNHFYEYLFMASMNYEDILSQYIGIFIIIILIVATYNIIVSLFFFPVKYIIVEEPELGIWEAVGKAFKMMKGHKWELFVLILSFIGWAILAVLPIVLGSIIIVLMNLSVKILPIFSIGLIWFFVYRDTIYRVYYLSI